MFCVQFSWNASKNGEMCAQMWWQSNEATISTVSTLAISTQKVLLLSVYLFGFVIFFRFLYSILLYFCWFFFDKPTNHQLCNDQWTENRKSMLRFNLQSLFGTLEYRVLWPGHFVKCRIIRGMISGIVGSVGFSATLISAILWSCPPGSPCRCWATQITEPSWIAKLLRVSDSIFCQAVWLTCFCFPFLSRWTIHWCDGNEEVKPKPRRKLLRSSNLLSITSILAIERDPQNDRSPVPLDPNLHIEATTYFYILIYYSLVTHECWIIKKLIFFN